MLPVSPRLSETAYDILKLNERGLKGLVVSAPGSPQAYSRLSSTDPSHLLTGDVKDLDMARAVACGLWLWHDYLDEAHRLAQGLPGETGTYWHAIMHRREGDFANSKYWLARCPDHPARAAIANQASAAIGDLPADNRLIRLTMNGWDAPYFVDLVQAQEHRLRDEFGEVLVILQQLEWRVLIEYCASLA